MQEPGKEQCSGISVENKTEQCDKPKKQSRYPRKERDKGRPAKTDKSSKTADPKTVAAGDSDVKEIHHDGSGSSDHRGARNEEHPKRAVSNKQNYRKAKGEKKLNSGEGSSSEPTSKIDKTGVDSKVSDSVRKENRPREPKQERRPTSRRMNRNEIERKNDARDSNAVINTNSSADSPGKFQDRVTSGKKEDRNLGETSQAFAGRSATKEGNTGGDAIQSSWRMHGRFAREQPKRQGLSWRDEMPKANRGVYQEKPQKREKEVANELKRNNNKRPSQKDDERRIGSKSTQNIDKEAATVDSKKKSSERNKTRSSASGESKTPSVKNTSNGQLRRPVDDSSVRDKRLPSEHDEVRKDKLSRNWYGIEADALCSSTTAGENSVGNPAKQNKAKSQPQAIMQRENLGNGRQPKFNINAEAFYPKGFSDEGNSAVGDNHVGSGINTNSIQEKPPYVNDGTTYFETSKQVHMSGSSGRDNDRHDNERHPSDRRRRDRSPQDVRMCQDSHGRQTMHERRRESERKIPDLRMVAKIDSEQAMTLMEQLNSGDYECMVCCEKVQCLHYTWNCTTCYHLFHLRCIRKWSKSEAAGIKGQPGWRCPACQTVSAEWPETYVCFCGKLENPPWNPRSLITPHSCGEVCRRPHSSVNCEHPCTELCHPGPCPSCPVMVKKKCCCGNKLINIRCGNTAIQLCGAVCNKPLNCLLHTCENKCHEGSCEECAIVISQDCHCGKHQRDVMCDQGLGSGDDRKYYSCNESCQRVLACGNHSCDKKCHPGACRSCDLLPGVVKYCHCGKTLIDDILDETKKRVSCLDLLPCCKLRCDKSLPCGPADNHHVCSKPCHDGDCVSCERYTEISCRCGSSSKDVPCSSISHDRTFECEQRCNSKKQCGRHRCNVKCCTDATHVCTLVCGKKLQCGHHKCEELCHRGYCQQCWQVGFDEVSCYCGTTVALPPIQCGASPPECPYPCTRTHPCEHMVQHNCHMDQFCPPCATLVDKLCMGGHENRHSIPCHVENVSCGQPCGQELSCKQHKCQKTCHKGPCLDDGDLCPHPCDVPRPVCEHPCGNRCHVGSDCPAKTPCKSLITITCDCGRRTEKVACLAGHSGSGYQRVMSATIGNKLRELQAGNSVDISTLFSADKQVKSLPCDEECRIQERNKRLAVAFGKMSTDSSPSVMSAHSQFLKDHAKDNMAFVKSVEHAIEEIVTSVKRTGVVHRTHSFTPMGSVQRRVIHELAKIYDCTTYSVDSEPMRSTVVTATKDSMIPSLRLSSVVEHEMLPPLPPRPVLLLNDSGMTFKQSSEEQRTKPTQVPDYFNDDTF